MSGPSVAQFAGGEWYDNRSLKFRMGFLQFCDENNVRVSHSEQEKISSAVVTHYFKEPIKQAVMYKDWKVAREQAEAILGDWETSFPFDINNLVIDSVNAMLDDLKHLESVAQKAKLESVAETARLKALINARMLRAD